MTGQRLLVASNRGPVTFREVEGELVPRRGSGGLVAALMPAVAETGGLWVAAAMSEGDRQVVDRNPGGRLEVVVDDSKHRLRMLSFDAATYDLAYNTVSNRLLWFLHHYLWDLPTSPGLGTQTREAWEAYRRFNRSFAEALAEEISDVPTAVLVQDYHLSLVPAELRALAPAATIAHFHHVPFAGPDYMRLLPGTIREELLSGLLGADLLGFQTDRWATNFLAACRLLEGAEVSERRRTVRWQGRTVHVGVYPISIDAAQLRAAASTDAVRERRRHLQRALGDRRLLLRVDRTDLSKNVLRGFQAYEDLLRRYPEWRGRVMFVSLLNPSRRGVPEYRAYVEKIVRAAERINDEFGAEDWTPIDLRIQDDYDRVLAAYSMYDVLVVNPLLDGMNLVAKEGALLNRHQGVLVLSRTAGAFAELGRHAVPVDPIDIAGLADAMDAALRMPDDQRSTRAAALRRTAASRTPARWAERQLRDLRRFTG